MTIDCSKVNEVLVRTPTRNLHYLAQSNPIRPHHKHQQVLPFRTNAESLDPTT